MSEVNALKTLRETTLAHLSQSDYERILKAVEVGGIQSLTGTASMIVKSAVLKHGSHDQSSHNPKKGGGGGKGGGAGGSSAPSGMTEEEFRAADKIALSSGSEAGAFLEQVDEREPEFLEQIGADFDRDLEDVSLAEVSSEDKKTYSDFKLGQEKLNQSLLTFSEARKSPVSSTKRTLLERGYAQFGEGIALTSGVMSNAETSSAENALESLGKVVDALGGERK